MLAGLHNGLHGFQRGGDVVRRTGPNVPRDTDSVAVPDGTLLGYASARDFDCGKPVAAPFIK